MKPNRTTTGLMLVVLMAGLGFLLLYLPQWAIAQYQAVKGAGRGWMIAYFTVVGTGAALLAVATLWTVGRLVWRSRRKAERRQRRDTSPSELSAGAKDQEIDENLESVRQYQDDLAGDDQLHQQLQPMIRELEQKRQEQTLEIVAFGTVSSGKSSLLNALAGRDVFVADPRGGTTLRRNEIPWPGIDRVLLVDTPGLGEVDGAEHGVVSADAAVDADLVLLVVDGPLRDSEYQLLQRLGAMEKRVLLCLNKDDLYAEGERRTLLQQLSAQVKDHIEPQDVVAVRSMPTHRKRVARCPRASRSKSSCRWLPISRCLPIAC